MKFKIDTFNAYVFNECEEGIYINNSLGFVMEAEQMRDIANKMIKCANNYAESLELHNKKLKIKMEKDMNEYNVPKKEKVKRFIYLLECGGKYKIGIAKDINKRIKQLDKRPFKVNLLANSKLTSNAYNIEQELHRIYENNRIDGEWFDFDKETIEELKNKIMRIC